jgi:hypothetical protein
MIWVDKFGGIHAHLFLLSVMSPAFMLGISHESGWLKRESTHRIYGRVEQGSHILGRFLHS